ncbi:Cupin domain-containing protein [Lachnospiraceae bacterium RM5]|nr:Cupin domain-containing protein [Lachnospiraceae bacterium RM5]
MLIEILKPDFMFSDERGSLFQLCHEGYKQFNIVFSKKGVIRGNHYHKKNKEVFFVVSGSFELIVSKNDKEEKYIFKKGDMFLIPPKVLHSFFYYEDTYLAAMYDFGVENVGDKIDIYSE